MSIKLKITSLIIAAVIAMTCLITGVWALANMNVYFDGSISFIPPVTDVYLNKVVLRNTVTQTSNGYKTTDVTVPDCSGIYIDADTQIDLSSSTVLAGQTMEIDLDLTSLSTDEFVKVNLSYSSLPSTVTVNSTSLFLEKNPTGDILDGNTATYKIFIKNTSASSVSLSGINLKISFTGQADLLQTHVETGNTYWYVEMGTVATSTGNEYLKWRFFSKDGSTAYNWSSTNPVNEYSMGYFLLESNPFTTIEPCVFNNDYYSSNMSYYHRLNGWDGIIACDYATSTVRQYINGNNVYKNSRRESSGGVKIFPSGNISNMYTDFNIDTENDYVFKRIVGRPLGDAYTSGGQEYFGFPDFPPESTITYSESDLDNFWLLDGVSVLGSNAAWSGVSTSWWTTNAYASIPSLIWVVDSTGNTTYSDGSLSGQLLPRAAFRMAF